MTKYTVFFNQNYISERTNLLRLLLGSACIVWIHYGVDLEFYSMFYNDLAESNSRITNVEFKYLYVLKQICILSGIVFSLSLFEKLSGFLFCISYFVINLYVAFFLPGYWNYNTHLLFFLIFVVFSSSAYKFLFFGSLSSYNENQKKYSSFTLLFCQLYVGVLYFQAGLSKLMFAGKEWFTEGQTIYIYAVTQGNLLGQWLTQFPNIFGLIGIATFVIEFSILPLILLKKFRTAGVLGLFFHLSTWVTLDISFWFLWWLYPALFLYADKNDEIQHRLLFYFSIIIVIVSFFIL